MLKSLLMLCALSLTGVASAKINQESLSHPHVPGDMLVTFSEGVTIAEQKQLVDEIGGYIVKRFRSSPSVLIRVPQRDAEFISSASNLEANPRVSQVGTNRLFSINVTPDDPKMDSQYHHELIGSEKAWSITTGSKDVKVAVIDTGIVLDHEDLVGNIWKNPGESGVDANGRDRATNGIDDDNNGYVDDVNGWDFVEDDNDPTDTHGHGTHCAGSIGAVSDNGIGIAGINWDVSLIGLRFIGNNGQGTEADAVEAIEYATMMGFDLTSNSWGGEPDNSGGTDVMYKAIQEAQEAGVVFVAASGNNGRNIDSRVILPAGYDLDIIISVASSDRRDRMSSFSNYGSDRVDLMAPGSAVYSTIKPNWWGSKYGSMSGTSMAAPIVAGAVALKYITVPSLPLTHAIALGAVGSVLAEIWITPVVWVSSKSRP